MTLIDAQAADLLGMITTIKLACAGRPFRRRLFIGIGVDQIGREIGASKAVRDRAYEAWLWTAPVDMPDSIPGGAEQLAMMYAEAEAKIRSGWRPPVDDAPR